MKRFMMLILQIIALYMSFVVLNAGPRVYVTDFTDSFGNQFREIVTVYEISNQVFKTTIRSVVYEDGQELASEIRTKIRAHDTVWRYRAGQIYVWFYPDTSIEEPDRIVNKYSQYELKLLRLVEIDSPKSRGLNVTFAYNENLIKFEHLSDLLEKESRIQGVDYVWLSDPRSYVD